MRLSFELQPHWPKLAWDASCRRGSEVVVVRHGPAVETRRDWFCEAAWDGEFEAGDFDRTDIVVGSGARLRESEILFVSAGNTVDRLQSLATPGGWRVSNSLACLVASGGAALDPSYGGYYEDFRTVTAGLRKLRSRVHTRHGELRLHYFNNLAWDGHDLSSRDKPNITRDFGSFEAYERFLLATMARIAANARDPARRDEFHGLGTVSTGYDSPTVAAIARRAGAFDRVLTFTTARGGGSDDGTPIASALGLEVVKVAREAYRTLDAPEIPFLASNAYGEESHYAGAEDVIAGRILYTGFHGDKVWAKDTKDRGPDIVRGDPTGLALTEYRLRAGFLHCPVPFWGVRQIDDIVRLSNARELAAWDVAGDYSRPVCRRIVEDAGVDRRMFGQLKNAASVTMFNPREKFLTEPALRDYLDWLEHTRGAPSPARRHLDHLFRLAGAALDMLPRRLRSWRLRKFVARRSVQLFYYLFPWAVDRAAAAYRIASRVSPEPPRRGGAERPEQPAVADPHSSPPSA